MYRDPHNSICTDVLTYHFIVTYSSNPVYNHSEMITGLHVSTNLHMFVSCSTDYTVRVWSEDNNILR